MALGTGIVLLPERTFAFAMAKFPAPEVATTTTGDAAAADAAARVAGVRAARRQRAACRSTDPLEKRLHAEIVCTCGMPPGARQLRHAECGGHAAQSEKIKQLMAEGKDHDAIVATFVRDFGGQDILDRARRQGLQPPCMGVPIRDRRLWRRRRRVRRQEMVAHARREPPRRRSPHRSTTPRCRHASIASSKTSTNPLPPTQPTSDTLRPWQFFTLGALVCATAAVFIIRGTSAENLIFVCLGIFAAALVGLAVLNA